MNPIPYRATFFGEKLHLDQNEKLNMFGVVHIIAVDGYSLQIVKMITIPRKNPISIYRHLFKSLLEFYGMWDQLRLDHGTELSLSRITYLASTYVFQFYNHLLVLITG